MADEDALARAVLQVGGLDALDLSARLEGAPGRLRDLVACGGRRLGDAWPRALNDAPKGLGDPRRARESLKLNVLLPGLDREGLLHTGQRHGQLRRPGSLGANLARLEVERQVRRP